MNLKEAYSTLELSEGASPEEAKKRFRDLTKKWHPDVNKSPEAEDKFKKINEAYSCVQNGKGNDREVPAPRNPFSRQQVIELENIETHLTIDFKDAVLGCKKEISYSRKIKCANCDGNGQINLNNGCKKCGGNGRMTVRQNGMVFVTNCPDCGGRTQVTLCNSCKGQGFLQSNVAVHVSVPAGILDGQTLRLQGMGNYAGSFMGLVDQSTDVYCHIKVQSEEGLSIDGKFVVSHLTIPLVDALQGCKRTVKTIFGNKEISIDPNARNRDEIILNHHGVGGSGSQKIILDVQYPLNTDKLINALLGKEN